MNKTLMMGSVISGVLLTAGAAMAGFHAVSKSRGAEVVSVTPVTHTVRTPRQDCHDEQVTHTRPAKDSHQLVGTGVGAALGGLVGSQFGGGSGKVLTTVAGVAAGGYAGNRVEKKMQQGETYTTTEQRCSTVYDSAQVAAGYDVVYLLKGEKRHIHMDHDPGARLPVKDGQVVVEAARTESAHTARSIG